MPAHDAGPTISCDKPKVSTTHKILFVVNDGPFFLSHRLALAEAARKAGYEVHVATPQDGGAVRIREHGFPFHPIPIIRGGTHPAQEVRSFVALWRLYRRLRPDLVHHVTIKPVLYGGIAARLARVPATVYAVTGLGYLFVTRSAKAAALRAVVKAIYRLALRHRRSRVIFQNPDDLAFFRDQRLVRPGQPALIRGSGVDTAVFCPHPEAQGAPVVTFASRMIWDKGIGEFIGAVKLLRGRGVEARFVLVGDTDPDNPAAVPPGQLMAWQASGLVEWWGRSDDMPAVFARSHVVCLPSYREGLPKVLIEAAACGRALVAADVPGCREIVRHGVNGLLVPARSETDLADALQALLDSPRRRKEMGAAGRRLAVEEFSLDRVVRETLELYRDLLS